MGVSFAKGKLAFGFCDTCGQRYDLKDLKIQVVAGRQTNIRNCPECLSKDHPQLFLGRVPINDPQALKNPRPDTSLDESTALWGWNPVGNPAIQATGEIGVIGIRLNGVDSPITYSGTS
jgi:hypothetical protein